MRSGSGSAAGTWRRRSSRVAAPPPCRRGLALLGTSDVKEDLGRPVRQAKQTIALIRVLLWIVAAGIIGAVVYLSVLERVRDLAALKAIGVATRDLVAGLILQAALLSLLAALLVGRAGGGDRAGRRDVGRGPGADLPDAAARRGAGGGAGEPDRPAPRGRASTRRSRSRGRDDARMPRPGGRVLGRRLRRATDRRPVHGGGERRAGVAAGRERMWQDDAAVDPGGDPAPPARERAAQRHGGHRRSAAGR